MNYFVTFNNSCEVVELSSEHDFIAFLKEEMRKCEKTKESGFEIMIMGG